MRNRGFTLLEIMIVIAIVGILASMSIATMEEGRGRTAPRNAAADLSSAVSQARARALERGSDVWLILYPARGNGAWFLYEDGDINFTSTTGTFTCDGSSGSLCNFATFDPATNKIWPDRSGSDRLLEREYFDNAPKQNVKFGNLTDTTLQWGAPFTTLNSSPAPVNTSGDKRCTFCSGTGAAFRGAVVFNGDGTLRFVDGNGATVSSSVGGFSIEGPKTSKQVTLFAFAAATGYVGVFQ